MSGPSDSRLQLQSPCSVLRPDELLTEVQFIEPIDGYKGDGKDGAGMATTSKHKLKLGHRRIDKQGEVSYKRVPTNALMGAIQLGIANSIGSLASKAKRDILVQDFQVIENVAFPTDGSQTTPSHTYGDFRFKTYAPIAFRYFRELFNIKPADFLSLCTEPLKELSNPGASGSIFYVSTDDKFIIKTVQHKEAEFLRTLLPGYYLNLHQNPRTLLPKFFGLFCYQSLGKNIRLLVMNNLLPQSIVMHHKFDLKGSTYKRSAGKSERSKSNPTLKDLDFNIEFKNGIILDAHTHDILMNIIQRDCLVLESFKIMDYSLLMGVHNIDLEVADCCEDGDQQCGTSDCEEQAKKEFSAASKNETWKSLQLDFNTSRGPYEEGGVPARNAKGERLLIFLGIIDILQSYRLFKKLEHTWKSVLHDGESISVTNPTFYASRFQGYVREKVFCRAVVDMSSLTSKHTNKFRSFVHSYMAMKQTPARQQSQVQSRTRSATENTDEQLEKSRMEAEPLLSQRGQQERRSYYNKNPNAADPEKKKKMERLFATKKDEDDDAQPQAPIVTSSQTDV
ncbi:phosphatidylinositol-4-phosphate 5-Kinase domain-containing protein [Ditylenchus destructor]|nr:phosphatidylinositol-4-phosphate 5-Kinase domain-containing protein [Ditylenchus destructor]